MQKSAHGGSYYSYAILMLGEGFTCPIGYSITAVAAPKAFMTQMMTIWSMSQSTGAALNTLLTNFYKEGSEIPFFVAIGLGVCAVGVVVAIFSKKACSRNGTGQERRSIKD